MIKQYVLQLPTNWAEVSKVMAVIQSELGGRKISDDKVVVDVTCTPEHDAELIFSVNAVELRASAARAEGDFPERADT